MWRRRVARRLISPCRKATLLPLSNGQGPALTGVPGAYFDHLHGGAFGRCSPAVAPAFRPVVDAGLRSVLEYALRPRIVHPLEDQ